MYGEMVLLPIIQADESKHKLAVAEAQVIAAAIATFYHNNNACKTLGFNAVESMSTPCIVMDKPKPFFYIIDVNEDLSLCVAAGARPNNKTKYRKCALVDLNCAGDVGMEDPEY